MSGQENWAVSNTPFGLVFGLIGPRGRLLCYTGRQSGDTLDNLKIL
jgi:hypothetical protein